MGQTAQNKMKNKKRTNITTTQDSEELKQPNRSQNGSLKISKSESECQTVEKVNVENNQKLKKSNKTKIVVRPEDFGMQHLSVLITMGDAEKTRAFFNGDVIHDPNEKVGFDGSTPLILAADKRHVEIVKLLLEYGADCTLTNNEGNNALMTAIKVGDADVINAIWPHRASIDLNHANQLGYTALHFAADRKWECCVQFLLGNGALPDCQTDAGITPLMIAAKLGDKKTAERLVQAKADLLAGDQNDHTAICKAMEHSRTEVLTYLLEKLSDEDAEVFLRAKLYYLKHPVEPCTHDDMYTYRLLTRLTRKPTLRDVFHNQKVISMVLDRMKEARQCPPDMLQLSALLCSIMFMFKKQPDVKLIKQYIYGGGPDFTTDTVKYYTDKMNVVERETIVCYLPIIGITEAPEGMSWLKKNALRLCEYSTCCSERLEHHLRYAVNDSLEDLDPDFTKVLTPIWKSFQRILFDIQKKLREKTMLELLEEEEREKERRIKKKEKRLQKRQTEKVKKTQTSEDTEYNEQVDHVAQQTKSSAVNDSGKAVNVSQNSNDNDNDLLSRSDVKNRKKQRPREMNNTLTDIERHEENGDPYTKSDLIENQMVVYSTSPDSWKMVQTKRHMTKDKDKNRGKQAIPDFKKEEQPKGKKGHSKTPRKGQEKLKHQRDRIHGGQSVCWADIAKGVPATKLPEKNKFQEENQSEFSYEDDFPTLTGTKDLTGINYHIPESKVNAQSVNVANIHDDFLKDNLICNSDGSGNPSTNSGLSLNSLCEVETCGPDEKYYSDEDVLAYHIPPFSEDVTYTEWEELANINNIGCSTAACTTGQHTVKQMNSDTIQYLVDAYIASDGTSVFGNKLNCSQTAQDILKTSQESACKTEPVTLKFDNKNKEETEMTVNSENMMNKFEKDNKEKLEFGEYHVEACNDERIDSKYIGTGLHATQTQRTDIGITQTAYARDPSPAKAPRKRCLPHKNNKLLQRRPDRHSSKKTTQTQEGTQRIRNITTIEISCAGVTGPPYDLNKSQHHQNVNADGYFEANDEETDEITFGWDDEDEEIPTWYTYSGPPTDLLNMNNLQGRRTDDFGEWQSSSEGACGRQSDNLGTSDPPGFTKTNCVSEDDIANDPCVVQYWTQPDPSSVRQCMSGQTQTRWNENVSNQRVTNDTNACMNTCFDTGPYSGSKDLQQPHGQKTDMTQKKVAEEVMNNYDSTVKKKTAVVKPLSQQWQHARHSVNCALGQSILENACRIDTTPDEVLYPSDLRGSPEPEAREPEYFPSFHEQTRLSADYHPEAISVFHKIQQIQLAQLKKYYDAFRGQLLERMSVYMTDFHYYASCIGLSEEEINNYLGVNQQQQNRDANVQFQNEYASAVPAAVANPLTNKHPVEIHPARHRCESRQDLQAQAEHRTNVNREAAQYCQSTNESRIKPGIADTAIENCQISATLGNVQPCQQIPPTNPEYLNPEHSVPTKAGISVTAEELKTIAARGFADQALQDIKAAYNAMVTHAIKSRRWREKLLDIRHMPATDINMIGNIVFPKVNQARYVIASRPDTVMLGFLLNGTPAAVRIVDWRTRQLVKNDLQRLIDLDVSKYFMSKYNAFSFHGGKFYIATDLYEYTLDEYLYKLKTDGQDSPLCTNKLIWQFLRGLNSIHQQCLMVHGEIRPGNIVLDISGNLKITGYGLGRKINSAGTESETSAEEKCWIAPEILLQEQADSFKADIWSAGMVVYFILSGGKQPIGAHPRDVVWNLSRRNLRMNNISEEAYHLLSVMISLNKAERPATSEALRHPYFWAEEKRLRFVLIAGSDVLRDLKMGIPMTGGPGDSMIDILNSVQSTSLSDWMSEIDSNVLKEMRTFRQYKNSVVELVLFIYNCCLHFEKMSTKAREIIDEPCKYFLTRFPTLFMTVYGAIKMSNRTEKTCYKPFF